MSFSIKPQKDYPVSDAELLGIKETVEVLKTFLESDQMIAPLSIAVSGDWGSGKTSLLKTLEKKLNSEKITTIFF